MTKINREQFAAFEALIMESFEIKVETRQKRVKVMKFYVGDTEYNDVESALKQAKEIDCDIEYDIVTETIDIDIMQSIEHIASNQTARAHWEEFHHGRINDRIRWQKKREDKAVRQSRIMAHIHRVSMLESFVYTNRRGDRGYWDDTDNRMVDILIERLARLGKESTLSINVAGLLRQNNAENES